MGSHLIVQMPANPGPVVGHALPLTIAQSEWSSFDECIDPSLVSPDSASNSHSFLMAG